MAPQTRSHDPGRRSTGAWPNGEPKSVRDAYDKLTETNKPPAKS